MDQLPEEVWRELQYEIAKAGLEYADNWRAYRYKDKYLFKEYLEQANKGCCGVFESYVYDDEGNKWIVGCNYGH